jgi:hypothetical protein
MSAARFRYSVAFQDAVDISAIRRVHEKLHHVHISHRA